MDPLSIATGAAGLATGCATIAKAIYNWIDDVVDVDENVSGLCDEVTALARVLDSVSRASLSAPRVVIAEIDPDESLWVTVRATLGDIQSTLDKLNQLLADVQKSSSVFSRGFLRKPTKQIKFSMRLKDIALYRDRVKMYNSAMTSALQMINVCLLIQNNSSQDAVFQVLRGLETQVKRVENAVQTGYRPDNGPGEARDEDDRITRNMQHFVRVAENFRSSASTVVNEGPRSTVWGGSIMGDPLTVDQFTSIEGWIPPPIDEEDEDAASVLPGGASSRPPVNGSHDSDSDDDLDRDLTKRLGELALESQLKGDFSKAETFYRRAIDRREAIQWALNDIPSLKVRLAYTLLYQEKWAEAEDIVGPIALDRKVAGIEVYHGMHVLALAHMGNADLSSADRCCKRALWGKRKILGKAHPSCWETIALLVSICEARSDMVEAEAHRSFIPATFQPPENPNPLIYLNRQKEGERLASPTTDISESGSSTQIATSQSLVSIRTPLQSNESRNSTPSTEQVARAAFSAPPMPRSTPYLPPQPQNTAQNLDPYHLPYSLPPQHQSQRPISPATNQITDVPPAPLPVLPYHLPRAYEPSSKGTIDSSAYLIVGVHYGAAKTSVAFAWGTNTEAKEDMITEWPGAGYYSKPTVPSVLYYGRDNDIVGWGYDIADALAPTGYPKPGIEKVEWFSLQLVLDGNTYVDPLNLPPLPSGKSPVDVSADYLFKIRQHIRTILQKCLGETFNRQEESILWVFTVPAVWNDAGKAALRAAVLQAGYLRHGNDNRLEFVAEPEASALFCSKTGLLNLKVQDVMLIIDCGSGTVDLAAYEVCSEQPLTLREATAGSGDSCGSTALNRNFSTLLRAKIRKMRLPDGSKTAGRVYAKAIVDFENRIKDDFRNNGQKWAVDVGIEAEFLAADISEGYMTFTNDEILSCFEPVIGRIVELTKNQIASVQAQNKPLQAILVTGEFGASEYLFQQLKLLVPEYLQRSVVRPMDSTACVVKGAVTAGISMRLSERAHSQLAPQIGSDTCPYFLLVEDEQPLNDAVHRVEYRRLCPDGAYRAYHTMQPLLLPDQRIHPGQSFDVNLRKFYQPAGHDAFYHNLVFADRIYTSIGANGQCPIYVYDPSCLNVGYVLSSFHTKDPESSFRKFYGHNGPYYLIEYTLRCTIIDRRTLEIRGLFQGEVLGDSLTVPLG